MSFQSQFDDAEREFERALALEPASELVGFYRARTLLLLRRYVETVGMCDGVLARDVDFVPALWVRAFAHAYAGRCEEALRDMARVLTLYARLPSFVGFSAWLHALSGDQAAARVMLAELEDRSREQHVPAGAFVSVYMGLRDVDRALEWVARAIDQHDGLILFIATDPGYELLWSDPRFAACVRRLNLAPVSDLL